MTPAEIVALMAKLDALALSIETSRSRLDVLVHAQTAMEINTILPYLQRISRKLGA